MTPTSEMLSRAEFEERMNAFRAEILDAGLKQDHEWNLGFRAIRDDVKHGIDVIREDVATRADVLEKLFTARLDPFKSLSEKIDRYIGPVAVLQKQAESAESSTASLTGRVTALENQSAKVYGFAAAVGLIGGWVSGFLKK